MEQESSRLHFYELFDKALAWNVAKHDIIRIVRQHGKLVGNLRGRLRLLLLECRVHLLNALARRELRMQCHLPDMPIADEDVPLNDLLQRIVVFILDFEAGADACTWRLVVLLDVNVDDDVVVEFPGECQHVVALRRWPEVELTVFFSLEQLDGYS